MRRRWRRPGISVDALAPAEVVAALVRDAIRRHGAVVWQAAGRSMGVSIRDGQAVRLVSPEAERLKEGEVVMAVLPSGRLAVHRVHAIEGSRLVLRGDANRHRDLPIESDSVIAVVVPRPPVAVRSIAMRLVP